MATVPEQEPPEGELIDEALGARGANGHREPTRELARVAALEAARALVVGDDAEHGEDPRPDEPSGIALDAPQLFFNRELSWLDFNDRVLQLAERSRTPLLERVKFLSIWSSNLDEFFMVRVAGLHDQVAGDVTEPGADGLSPSEVIDGVRAAVISQLDRVHALWANTLIPALAKEDIKVVSIDELDAEQRDHLNDRFRRQVLPVLTPLAVQAGRPFPYISGLSMSLAVLVRDPRSGQGVG